MNDWPDICEREAEVLARASQVLVRESLRRRDGGIVLPTGPVWIKQRRAELYRKYLDRAGLDIVTKLPHDRARLADAIDIAWTELQFHAEICQEPTDHRPACEATLTLLADLRDWLLPDAPQEPQA